MATKNASAIRARVLGILVFMTAVIPYALTATQRGYYSDDFSLRRLIVENEWWRTYPEYYQIWGGFRPLGAAAILVNFSFLWQAPALMHGCLSLVWGMSAWLLFQSARLRLDCELGALAATACYICWPTTTTSVCWPTAAAETLPAILLFLAALMTFGRELDSAGTRSAGFKPPWPILFFGLSVLFHDQQLGAAVVFSIMAAVNTPSIGRTRAVLRTWPFYVVSLVVGWVSVATSQGGIRPLNPNGLDAVRNSVSVLESWLHGLLQVPYRQWVSGTGFREGLIDGSENDLPGLILSWSVVAALLGAMWIGRPTPGSSSSGRRSIELMLSGLGLFVVSLLIMAARPDGGVSERHTLWPSLGLALAAGGLMSWAATTSLLKPALALCAAVLSVCFVMKSGYIQEWALRNTATQAMLRDVAATEPPLREHDLLVIDNVRRLGRGFADSWGLSDAMSMTHGMDLRVATTVRAEGRGLVANAAWDRPWPVDPSTARFFRWNHQSSALAPISVTEYLEFHPELSGFVSSAPDTQLTSTFFEKEIAP